MKYPSEKTNGSTGGGSGSKPTPSKILLVDDRKENLVALAAVLEPLGQDLVLASSGAEALRRVLVDDFAVILLDVQMPDMDGFEAATLIRQREKSRYIPIIFVTAINTEDRYAFRGYQSGAVDYLPKPIDSDVLRSKVTVFVELHQQAQQIRRQQEELHVAQLRQAEQAQRDAEREREQKHLADLEEREAQLRQFKATLDATLDAVFLFDPKSLRFFYVNQGASSLVGYSPLELLNMTPVELDADGGIAELQRVLAPLLAGGVGTAERAQTYETRVRHKSGRVIPVEVMTQYIAPGGGGARFVSIVRDITERKKAEGELAVLYQREKRIAEALQQSIVFAPPEDLFPGLTIATLYQAAWDEASVGGDYLDVFALEKNKVALVVGDVSGKGLTAAARTAEVKYALRAFLRETPDPALALGRLNTLLCETKRFNGDSFESDGGGSHFICVSVAVIDPKTGEALVAVAGAEQPLIVRSATGAAEPVIGGGAPVGIDGDMTHENMSYTLEKGDVLMLLTDGITEARRGKEFFGYEGFVGAATGAIPGGTIHAIGKSVLETAKKFAGGKLQDDACLLLAARN